MKTLRKLQYALQRYILSGEGAAVKKAIAGGYGAAVDVRMGIYHDAYRLRLIEALRADYPALAALLGEQEFNHTVRAYIDGHRSPYYNIRWYGDELATFLRESTPWSDRPWLAEMAAFEWGMLAAFDAPNAPVLNIDAVAAVAPADWPELRFVTHPSVRIVQFAFETPVLWKAYKNEKEVRDRRPAASSLSWLIWRKDVETFFRSLNADEARALTKLLEGGPFAEVCDALSGVEDDTALRAASLLKGWLSEGLLSRIER